MKEKKDIFILTLILIFENEGSMLNNKLGE